MFRSRPSPKPFAWPAIYQILAKACCLADTKTCSGGADVSAADKGPKDDPSDGDPAMAGKPFSGSVLLQTCPPISHAEITEKLLREGSIRGAVLEAQDDSKQPKYAAFLLPSWRKAYCVLHIAWPARPRLFRDLDRLLVLIRFEYRYKDTIALKRIGDDQNGKRFWRMTLKGNDDE